jgi:hypothetical protein
MSSHGMQIPISTAEGIPYGMVTGSLGLGDQDAGVAMGMPVVEMDPLQIQPLGAPGQHPQQHPQQHQDIQQHPQILKEEDGHPVPQ